MLRSRTIANPDWLHNARASEVLEDEFLVPIALSVEALGQSIEVEASRLRTVIDGSVRIDADLDLRLARCFRMSEGFFLGLQIDHERLEAKRQLNGKLDRIEPRPLAA